MEKIVINKKDFKQLYDVACHDWKLEFDKYLTKYVFSDTIDFEMSFIEKMKNACTSEQLPIFEKVFKSFLPKDEFEGIVNYSSFCKISGLKEWYLYEFEDHIDPKKSLAQEQLSQIEYYFGKNWKKDWNNKNQNKYAPYFDIINGRLVFLDSSDSCFSTYGGAAYFKDKKTSDFVGNIFLSIYENLL